jgi:2,4-dienoyl-CoA reductase-like NADH-dependent reductase (Old Yellow Enzyme family)
MVAPNQLEAPGNAIIPNPKTVGEGAFAGPRFEAFKAMAEEGKRHGSLMVGQVSHPGRQVFERINPDPVSASDVQLKVDLGNGITFAKPHPATEEEIEGFVESFAYAAEYLEKAGFDGIQMHGAHGRSPLFLS